MNNNSFFKTLQSSYRQGLRNTKYRWFIVLGTLAYLASPIDIVPDVLPGMGWIDDGIIATLLVSEVSQLLVEQRQNRRQNATMASAQPMPETVVDVSAFSA